MMAPASAPDTQPLLAGDEPQPRSVIIQLTATTARQVRQAVRRPCSLCVEALLPVVFVLLFAWLSTLTHNDHFSGEIIYAQPPKSLATAIQDVSCLRSNISLANPTTAPLQALIKRTCAGTFIKCNLVGIDNVDFCLDTSDQQALQEFEWFQEPKNVTALPSLDYILLSHVLTIAFRGPIAGALPNNSPLNAMRASGKIFIVPDNAESRLLEQTIRNSPSATLWASNWFGGFNSSQEAAFDYFTSLDGAGKAQVVLTVNAFTKGNVDVVIGFNKTSIFWPIENTDRFTGGAGDSYKKYFASGFLSLEKIILSAFNDLNGGDTMGDAIAMTPMPYQNYVLNIFLTIAGTMAPLGLCLGYLYAVSQIAKRLVEEKELRLREAMAAMGMSKTVILVAWLLFFVIINLVTATLCTIVLKMSFVSHSDGSVIWVLMMLFSMTTSALGGLISSFFSKSRTASVASPILFFACSIPSFALGDNATPGTLRPLSLLSPTAFATALKLVFQYELNTGIGWNDIANPNDDITLGFCIFMLIVDLLIYTLLTWYLDNVLAGEWGVRQHPCFCFLNCFYACKQKSAGSSDQALLDTANADNAPHCISGASEAYPSVGAQTRTAVVFEGVCKTFGSGVEMRRAVSNFNLKIFSGMVTAVLGHNGAGKTTLFNMLTGMLPLSEGDCRVYGSSIVTDREAARSHIGMCPQHNILWADLTCFEHLRYFAWVKGTPFGKCAAEAEEMLKSVDLDDKRNALAASLSGGQKRKLSVAIAFIGGSKLVLLDEPTAGMDVHTRRHTWNLIQHMARVEKRTIILTTHFMDEAELLGDRVAMMTAGQLHSYGTTTFLKARLGEGYTLAVQFAAQPLEATRQAVLRQVQSFVRTAREKEARGREQFIVLPMDEVAHFPAMLRALEEAKATHNIVSVSMTVATIEDVFVKIATDDEHTAEVKAVTAYGVDEPVKDVTSESERKFALRTSSVVHEDITAVSTNVNMDGKLSAAAAAAATIASVRTTKPGFSAQFVALMMKRFGVARRDNRAVVLQLVMPVLCILLAMALASLSPPSTPATRIDAHVLADKQFVITGGCDATFNTAMGQYIDVTPAPATPSTTLSTANFLYDTANAHGSQGRTIAVQCLDPTETLSSLDGGGVPSVLFSNSTAYLNAAPYALIAYYNARAAVASKSKPTVSIWNGPLPWTVREQRSIKSVSNAIMALLIVVPLSFIPSTFTGFVVKERESKAKLLQFVSGVGYGAYWASNFLFDLVSFIVTELLAFIIFAAFSRKEYVGDASAFGATFLLITMYAVAAIPTAYVMSLAFRDHSTAQNAVLGIFFLAGFGLTLTTYLLRALGGPTWLSYIFRFFPPECLGEGLMAIANAPSARQAGVDVNLYDMDQMGWPLLYLAGVAIATGATILFVDHPERTKRQQMLSYKAHQSAPVPSTEPADVAQERAIVDRNDTANSLLRVVSLRKEYAAPAGSASSTNIAVRNLTFQVPKGEIFCLLGTNGAGKTTSMNVVTGECLPTMGHAYVNGFDVVEQAGEARTMIGYCPQFDALHDLLTVNEHLALYCQLRGVQDSARIVDALCDALGLTEYRRNKSMSLSGGNKRKLSVAIALLGAPKLLLLDEPTAGMDPVARRSMCDVVAAISQHCAVVLTTHHLEEVEALADRAAIMVGGAMQCLGTLEHLKETLGAGYQVSIRLGNEENAEACIKRMEQEYPGQAKLLEQHLTKLSFNVKQGGKALGISHLFEFLYELKARETALTVVDYTVSQSSVEEVFLAVAGGNANEMVANATFSDEQAASFVVRQASTRTVEDVAKPTERTAASV